MYIYRNDKIIERIPVSKIDSVVFVAPKSPAVPDVPETPVYEAIDLGLPSGVKWATCNVGATKPEEYGGYYAWGETDEKDDYSWSTYKWCNGTYDSMTKYCTSAGDGTIDNKTVLELEDDVAHVKWGGNWRMPTKAEQDELRDNCTWTWTTLNGVRGYEVTGPNGNSIFLPAAGNRNGTEVEGRGYYGNSWSSSLSSDYSHAAYELGFGGGNYYWYNVNRYLGQSVRPVSGNITGAEQGVTLNADDGLPGVMQSDSTMLFTSPLINLGTTNKVRMTVVGTVDGRTENSGHVYFSLSELAIYDEEGKSVGYVAKSNAEDIYDGKGLSALNDGKTDEYFHSMWSLGVDTHHYIELELERYVGVFKLVWNTRPYDKKNAPTVVGITAGTDYLP